MINRIKVKGWRSLADIELEIKPLNVLIGPNGSGKSSTLDLFRFISEAARGALLDGILRRGGWQEVHFKGEGYEKIFFEFVFDESGDFQQEGGITYSVDLVKRDFYSHIGCEKIIRPPTSPHTTPFEILYRDLRVCKFANVITGLREDLKTIVDSSELAIFQYQDRSFYPTPAKLLANFYSWIYYRPIRVGLDSPVRSPQLIKPGTILQPDGSNLISVLYNIKEGSPYIWSEIIDIIKNVYPGFSHLTFPPGGGDGKFVMEWWEKAFKDEPFSQQFLSDGTIRWLSLIAILKNPKPPNLICIDEPELSMHPEWIKVLGDLIKEASAMTQIFVATHSPELIARLEADDIILINKKNGITVMNRPKRDELRKWLDEFRLGDLWRMNILETE